MTDNDIIKAFMCCHSSDESCGDCPYINGDGTFCSKLLDDVLDLVIRQQAEIENLNIELQAMRNAANGYKKEVERLKGWQDLLKAEKHSLIKAEAVKDLLIRLTMHFATYRAKDTITIKDMFQMIQKIAEEAVGDE